MAQWSGASTRRTRAVPWLALAVVTGSLAATAREPVDAWKPSTHTQTAFAAYDDAVDDGFVSVGGVQVPVDPELLVALRSYPEAYRGGVLGPDAYPDIYVGQAMIHPDTRTDNDREPLNAERTSYTDDWLRHVWDSALAVPPGPGRLQARAFAAGFLTHAAGDVWGHTFVNHFAGGVFPSITDVSEIMIAIRHIIVEGYIDHRRPVATPDPADVSRLAVPEDFIVSTLITSTFARDHSAPVHFDWFWAKRAELLVELARDRIDLARQDTVTWSGWWGSFSTPDFSDAPASPLETPVLVGRISRDTEWLDSIEQGLARWPQFSTSVAQALLGPESDFAAAKNSAVEFTLGTILPMLGVPRALADLAVSWRRSLLALEGLARSIAQPVIDAVERIETYAIDFLLARIIDLSQVPAGVRAVLDTNGDSKLGLAELRAVSTTDLLAENPAIIAPSAKAELDSLLGIDADHRVFDPARFAGFANTVTLSKLVLVNRDGLNQLATRLGVSGDLYPAVPGVAADRVNVMLGWIRSIDGEYQWRDRSLGSAAGRSFGFGTMRMWEDCRARSTVFTTIFAEPLPGAFAEAGDACTVDPAAIVRPA